MALHGQLIVDFRINNIRGSDMTLTRTEAKWLYEQLGVALQMNKEPKPRIPRKERAATKVTVTK